MDLNLRGKVALVTGGASGIGAATVRLLIAEGARVALVDRDADRGVALTSELAACAQSALFISADLAQEMACARCVAETVRAFGGIDVLINNAGANDTIALEASPGEFNASLQRNLFHFFAVTHFALEHLKKSHGVIVNITSKVALTGQGRTSGYAAAKGGVNALTREWAAALCSSGVRVNAVAPAECLTTHYERWLQSQLNPSAAKAAVENLIPLGRRMTLPEEIAATVVFLASERSSHTTGQIVFVDGGYTHLDRALSASAPQW